MANFLFWLFTLAAALLIEVPCFLALHGAVAPVTVAHVDVSGRSGLKAAAEIQHTRFAQVYSGRFWVRAGRPVLAVSLVWMLLLFDRDIGTVGTSAVVLMGIQMLPFLAVIPATERVLRRKFG